MPERVQDRFEREQEFNIFIGARVRALREEYDYSLSYVAQQCDMDLTKLSRVERGERGLSLREAAKLATVLHTSLTTLLRV